MRVCLSVRGGCKRDREALERRELLMVYDYLDDETREIVRRDFPMSGDIPRSIVVGGKTYRRDYGAGCIPAIHIPYKWGNGENPIRVNKSPSGRRHFF
jgi:hypothetical protein